MTEIDAYYTLQNVFEVTDILEDKEYDLRNWKDVREIVSTLNKVTGNAVRLQKENKQLKELIADKNKTQTETLKQLTQTQKELITIKNTIKEMYDNERTHLGHNVLAQLIEAIQ